MRRKSTIERIIKRFEDAHYEKAFEGTIPWDSEEAYAAHEEIDREYKAARKALAKALEN